jgi:hypothetical protein
MKRFVQSEGRAQGILLPELLDEYVAEANSVRAVAARDEFLHNRYDMQILVSCSPLKV